MTLLRLSIMALLVVAAGGCKGGDENASAENVKETAGGAANGDPTGRDTDTGKRSGLGEALASAGRTEHAVFELGANRHLAHHLMEGDLVLDGGSPGFSKYTRFSLPRQTWKTMRAVDGRPTAEPNRSASLEFPITAEQKENARAIWALVHSTKAGKVTFKVNGRKLVKGRISVSEGWQVVSVDAEGRWDAGENQLVVETNLDGDDVHLGWIRISQHAAAGQLIDGKPATPSPAPTDGTTPPPPPPIPAGALEPLAGSTWDAAAGGYKLADGGGLAWYLQLPVDAHLVAEIEGTCKVEVSARDHDGGLASGTLSGKKGRVDLGTLAGKVARVELRARDCAAGGVLKNARVTLAGADGPAPPDGAAPKYVIFWVMDALRADKVAIFTPGARAETPNWDKLGATGAVFRQHYVGGNESQVSHSSMFTGLYPAVHTVRTAGTSQAFTIPKKFPILGRIMLAAGYHTIGVTANYFVHNSGGYSRGFEEYRNLMSEKGVVNGRVFGDNIVNDVIGRLEKHKDDGKPLFIFMGTVDTHSPWIARDPWIDRYSPDPYDGPFKEYGTGAGLGFIPGKMGCHKIPKAVDIERLRAIYDSAVSYQDALIGDLLAALDKLGIRDQTMIVISADHGEELFEEKRCGHGASLRETLARVPLLVNYPPRIPARIVAEGSEGIDILPTILDTIGAPIPETVQGQSLRELAAGRDGAGWAQPSYASQYEYAFAVRIGRWKARVKRGTPLILDMEADPLEYQDLSGTRPMERRYLSDHLSFYIDHRTVWKKSTWGVTTNMTEAGAAALEEFAAK